MEQTAIIWAFISICTVLLMSILYMFTLHVKTVKYMSDRILANSLGEAKLLDIAKDEDVMEIRFPKDDELLAKEEEVHRKKRLIDLRKQDAQLEKEMKKTIKMYG